MSGSSWQVSTDEPLQRRVELRLKNGSPIVVPKCWKTLLKTEFTIEQLSKYNYFPTVSLNAVYDIPVSTVFNVKKTQIKFKFCYIRPNLGGQSYIQVTQKIDLC
jgi:hypothetical protein